jgi:hemoglobin
MSDTAPTAPEAATAPAPNPYELIGGEPVLRRVAAVFYERMASEPRFAPLRAMHAPDLAPMQEKLGDFLIQWTGGPPVYFQRSDARCMGQAHAPYDIDADIRAQWLECMAGALDAAGVPAAMRPLLDQALARMSAGMVNRGQAVTMGDPQP